MTQNRRLWALCAFLFAAFFAWAIDWPVKGGTLISNFGRDEGGIPALGNSFAASGSIFPADVGELIFSHDPENSRFPSPLGSWLALDHGDNLVGVYGRYENHRERLIPSVVEKGTVLASTGTSGWAREEGLYFGLFDRRERRWINPSVIISGLEDTRPPVIRQVELRSAAGTPFNPALTRNIPQGLYTIYVDAVDTIAPTREILAPNRITCAVNGEGTGMLSFETLAAKNGKRIVYRNGPVSAEQVYAPQGFGLGEIRFTRGQATIVIEAQDMAGNNHTVTYRLNVE
ncbi:MAG: M23 family metallopeptidase [Treponema sp.]|jgi:hypothetical protein|nr:M23 family metallopeptidase [Treponema sp.]